MAKISHVLPDDWLATYISNYVVDTLAPSERMQFRMACGRGAEAVAEWADSTLPKYTSVWRRLKSAQRQRRFRAVPSTEKWMTDWKAAERTLGKHITATLRRNRATLGQSTAATPAEMLTAALAAFEASLPEARTYAASGGDDAALPPRSVERNPTAKH
jgi:plasmid stability protein/predicted Fe-S protein YdhL (DUF1289 family)